MRFFFNVVVYMCIYVLILIYNEFFCEIKYNDEYGVFLWK